jgi:hypothetical protein
MKNVYVKLKIYFMNCVKYKNSRCSNSGTIFQWKAFTPSETYHYRKLLAKTPTVLKQIAMSYLDKQNNYAMYLARLKYDIVSQDSSVNRNTFWGIADMWSHHEMCQFIVREKIYVPPDEILIPLIVGYTRENQKTGVISSTFRNSIVRPHKPIAETREAFQSEIRPALLPQSLPIMPPPPPLIVTECDDVPSVVHVVVESVLSELGHNLHSPTLKDSTNTTPVDSNASLIIPGTVEETSHQPTDNIGVTEVTNTGNIGVTEVTNIGTTEVTDTDTTHNFDVESWMIPNAVLKDSDPNSIPTLEELKSNSTSAELTQEPSQSQPQSQCQIM